MSSALLNVTSTPGVFLAFPPDTACFSAARAQKNDLSPDICPKKVTAEMVAFLNLTSEDDNKNFLTAYCTAPPPDDSCPFGYCSQPDIAGILVRVSTYVTNICLTLLVFYGENFEDTFYTTLLQLYSILVTAVLTVVQKGLTKLHAVTALSMIASPVTVYILVYSIRNALGGHTRLDALVGQGKIAQRVLVIAGMMLWLGLVIFTFIPSNLHNFSQPSCESPFVFQNVNVFIFSPFFFILGAFQIGDAEVVVPTMIALLTVFATLLSFPIVYLKRRMTLPSDGSFSVRLATFWQMIKDEYPFLHFMLVIFIPSGYWITSVEVGLIGSNDQELSLSFGQVLATFVAVPPVVAVAKMTPRLLPWFLDLSWVRMITRTPKRNPASTGRAVLPEFAPGQDGLSTVSYPVKYPSMDYGQNAYLDPRSSVEKPAPGQVYPVSFDPV